MTSECPELTSGGRPPWCGACDPRTRLTEHGGYLRRCAHCHPSAHKPLAQHKICGGCRQTVYAFDTQPCGEHQPLGIDTYGHRAGRTLPAAVPAIASEARQAITAITGEHP
jgi:hypothetical protein